VRAAADRGANLGRLMFRTGTAGYLR